MRSWWTGQLPLIVLNAGVQPRVFIYGAVLNVLCTNQSLHNFICSVHLLILTFWKKYCSTNSDFTLCGLSKVGPKKCLTAEISEISSFSACRYFAALSLLGSHTLLIIYFPVFCSSGSLFLLVLSPVWSMHNLSFLPSRHSAVEETWSVFICVSDWVKRCNLCVCV